MSNAPAPNGPDQGTNPARSVAVVGVISIVLLTVGLVLIAVALASNAQTAGPSVVVVRDLLIIVMALELIVIGTATVVLLVQVARFINLLTNEVQPLITSATDTVNAVRGTALFVSKHVTEPIISTAGTMQGVSKVLSDVEVIRKAAGVVMQAAVSGTPTGARSGTGSDGTAAGLEEVQPQPEQTDKSESTEGKDKSSAPIRDNF
jgi:hypothetical protein